VSRATPRQWFAVDCQSHYSPPLARLRKDQGPLADVYFYRSYCFAKLHAPQGFLERAWPDLAVWINWPDSQEELETAFRTAGIVTGPRAKLYLWEETNGWIIRDRTVDAQRKRAERSAKANRAKAQQARRAAKRTKAPILDGRSVGRGFGLSAGQKPDVHRTSTGRPPDARKARP
jgi:hypothetical protein